MSKEVQMGQVYGKEFTEQQLRDMQNHINSPAQVNIDLVYDVIREGLGTDVLEDCDADEKALRQAQGIVFAFSQIDDIAHQVDAALEQFMNGE